MKNLRNELLTAAAILAILTAFAGRSMAQNPIKIVPTEQGFVFSEGTEKVLVYQRTHKSLDGKYTRANYVHPLYGLDGEVVIRGLEGRHGRRVIAHDQAGLSVVSGPVRDREGLHVDLRLSRFSGDRGQQRCPAKR